jgi:hypothetical protein
MARTKEPTRAQNDPRWVTVQMQIRVPWWRREQLQAEADTMHVSLPDLCSDALDRVYKPTPPT